MDIFRQYKRILVWLLRPSNRELIKHLAIAQVIYIVIVAILYSTIDLASIYHEITPSDALEWGVASLILLGISEIMVMLGTAGYWLMKNRTVSVSEYIASGESEIIEFKETLRIDLRTGEKSPAIEHSTIKTIAGFLNSQGGTLIIGVQDNGNVVGVERDYATLPKQNRDGLLVHIDNILQSRFPTSLQFISARVEISHNKEICAIEVAPSENPVYIVENGQEEFYIRSSASTRSLSMSESNEYIKSHFK